MPQINQDAANIPSVNLVEQGSDIATPGTGHVQLYVKSGAVYIRLDDGTVLAVGGAVALTEDSLAVGGAGDVLAALTPGAEGAVPTRQADGTIEEVVPTPGGGGDVTLIAEHVVAAGGEASVTFSNIPGTYRHLRIVVMGRSERGSAALDELIMRLNGDSNGNYDWHTLIWNGSGTLSPAHGEAATSARVGELTAATATESYPASLVLHIPSYAETVYFKTGQGRLAAINAASTSGERQGVSSFVWRSTAAITSVTFLSNNAADIAEGSRFSLYGTE